MDDGKSRCAANLRAWHRQSRTISEAASFAGREPGLIWMGIATALFAIAAAAIVAAWGWLGAAVEMPPSPLAAGEKLYCISYAPFRGSQNPFGPDVPIDPGQIDEDLAQLKRISNCVRTYSVDHGLDQIPEIARRHGLKVLQGLWLSNRPDRSRYQVETAIALANRYPDVIAAVIVGNEVLLRGEMSPPHLSRTIREVKAQVSVPVTYADVWEFWLRHREIAAAVDFVTIHILPYWEDFPIPARDAARHVDAIRKRVVAAFPDKDVFVGEFGWPSAGRMREAALPSPVDQARTLHEVVALARRENYRVNLIEAYDQPWKRQLEGTVGGYWGVFDAYQRDVKYPPGVPITNFPSWKLYMAAGMVLSAFTFLAAIMTLRRRPWTPRLISWIAVAISATTAGSLLGIAADKMFYESYGIGGWLKWGALLSAAIASPILCANAQMMGRSLPTFLELLGPRDDKTRSAMTILLGLVLAITAVIAGETALGFSFDPRYRDFPYASLTMAVVPFMGLMVWNRPQAGARPIAEAVFAGLLAMAAVYVGLNEGRDNWQSMWTCAMYLLFALTLWRARAVQSPE
jgi:exo-beta-1,3-glucanase (GH17 family)